jgi:hypothetical protein
MVTAAVATLAAVGREVVKAESSLTSCKNKGEIQQEEILLAKQWETSTG